MYPVVYLLSQYQQGLNSFIYFLRKFINEKEVLVMPGSKLRVDKALTKTGEYAATLVGFSFDATKKYDLSFPQAVVDNLSLIVNKW